MATTPAASLRPCEEHDLPALLEIYAPFVREGLASFEIDVPSLEEMRARRRSVLGGGWPYLVGERDGQVVTYAYAAPYRPRPAYRFTVESSVYVRPGHHRLGLGRLAMEALLAECRRVGARQVIAAIGDSANAASIGLHTRLGFRRVGLLEAVGFKLGRWVDVVLMQRGLGDGAAGPPDR